MDEGDIVTVKEEETSSVNLIKDESPQTGPDIEPVASSSDLKLTNPSDEGGDGVSLEDVIRAVLKKKVAENPLWSDELKQRMSSRLIQLYDQETEKSKKEALLKPSNPDVEKKKAVDALLEEANKQLLATVELRKTVPPQCVEYCARMARLECNYYKHSGTGPGAKERIDAAKQKYKEENEATIAKETERGLSLSKEIEEVTKEATEVAQALEAKHSNLRKIIDIRSAHRKSRSFVISVKEEPACLPASDLPIGTDCINDTQASDIK